MTWFDRWFYKQTKKAWENKDYYEQQYEDRDYKNRISAKMHTLASGSAMVERGNPEGQDRITFELTSAVGGRILNVRRYDDRKDRHDNQTYVIASGEDVGTRVAKIINLELLK